MSGPVRVLVVEDEALAAEAHASYVGRVPGFELAGVARSAADAARALESRPVDLVLLDLHLPDGHGLVLLRRLRAAGHDVDVIAVTSARDSDVVRSAVAQGVVMYLLKPFTFASFAAKLRQYAEYRSRLGEQGTVAQDEVDRAFGALRPAGGAETPKGMSPETMEQVLDAVRRAGAPVSATEVAERTAVSRVTARRYLEQLTERRVLTRSARYGGSGRPELEYRLEGGPTP